MCASFFINSGFVSELLLQSQVFFFLFLQLNVWASLCGMTYVQRLSHERKKQSSSVKLYIFSELAEKPDFERRGRPDDLWHHK